jgi:hypothetical protein
MRSEEVAAVREDVQKAMTTQSPPPNSDVVPVDPNPKAFHEVRVVLVAQAVVLAVLGVWGLAGALISDAGYGYALVADLSTGQSLLLLATAALSALGTLRRGIALLVTGLQFAGYSIIFMTTTGQHSWIAGPRIDIVHGVLAALGLLLVMWLAARALDDVGWARRHPQPH